MTRLVETLQKHIHESCLRAVAKVVQVPPTPTAPSTATDVPPVLACCLSSPCRTPLAAATATASSKSAHRATPRYSPFLAVICHSSPFLAVTRRSSL